MLLISVLILTLLSMLFNVLYRLHGEFQWDENHAPLHQDRVLAANSSDNIKFDIKCLAAIIAFIHILTLLVFFDL